GILLIRLVVNLPGGSNIGAKSLVFLGVSYMISVDSSALRRRLALSSLKKGTNYSFVLENYTNASRLSGCVEFLDYEGNVSRPLGLVMAGKDCEGIRRSFTSCTKSCAARSAIMMVGALVLLEWIIGMTGASYTRS